MNFISLQFAIFVVSVVFLYFLTPKRFQWITLLVGSYVFYLFSSVPLTFLLAGSTLVTFLAGILIGRINRAYTLSIEDSAGLTTEDQRNLKLTRDRRKRWTVTGALFFIFGLLAFMKYYNFMAVNIDSLLSLITHKFSLTKLNILLPLGISFYTFQSAGYLIDVYRGKVQPDRNIAKFALFVSFFPQIVQGPISRYDELAEQLYAYHGFDYERFKFGLQLILWGLFKKLVIADRAAVFVNTVFDHYGKYRGFVVFVAALFYCIQIYGDFSGGIDIARGIAQILGIDLPQNFRRPFFAISVSDFWRRWHITLSSWMRDYIFYPLSLSKSFSRMGRALRKKVGNQAGKLIPTLIATIITFFTVGIWHGANWKFIVYGLYNGVFIFWDTLTQPLLNNLQVKHKIDTSSIGWKFFQVLGTIIIIGFGRYFSRAPSLAVAIKMLRNTFQTINPWVFFDGTLFSLGLNQKNLQLLLVMILVLFVVELIQEKGIPLRQKLSEQIMPFRWLIYLLLIFSIIVFGVYGLDFNVADFIYRGF